MLRSKLLGLYKFFSSLYLALTCLSMFFILIIVGTLAQVESGIYYTVSTYFTSFWVYYPLTPTLSIPIFPGGATLGIILMINLVCAQIRYLKRTWNKIGIWFIHTGVILFLLGGGLTSHYAIESQMRIKEGETTNYSVSRHEIEMVLIDVSNQKKDIVYSFTDLYRHRRISNPNIPFDISIEDMARNSDLTPLKTPKTDPFQGVAQQFSMTPLSVVKQDNYRNHATAIISLIDKTNHSPLGTWLVSTMLKPTQIITYGNKTYRIELRYQRYYYPFYVQLHDFTHKIYPGTSIPKDFSSKVSLLTTKKSKIMDALIYMNHPLRYEGYTFFQASFAENDTVSILQVVDNPSWLLPYLACLITSIGLLLQFGIQLARYIKRSKKKEFI